MHKFIDNFDMQHHSISLNDRNLWAINGMPGRLWNQWHNFEAMHRLNASRFHKRCFLV